MAGISGCAQRPALRTATIAITDADCRQLRRGVRGRGEGVRGIAGTSVFYHPVSRSVREKTKKPQEKNPTFSGKIPAAIVPNLRCVRPHDRMIAPGLGQLDKSGIAELTFKDRCG
jgi:hypothetical protein